MASHAAAVDAAGWTGTYKGGCMGEEERMRRKKKVKGRRERKARTQKVSLDTARKVKSCLVFNAVCEEEGEGTLQDNTYKQTCADVHLFVFSALY